MHKMIRQSKTMCVIAATACVCVFVAGCGSSKSPTVKAAAVPDAPPKTISREKVEATVKLFAKNLGERYRTDAKWAERFKAEDGESVNEILRPACKENGITQEEYEWALSEDKELKALQRKLVEEAVSGTSQ
jgi:hypothetical protein